MFNTKELEEEEEEGAVCPWSRRAEACGQELLGSLPTPGPGLPEDRTSSKGTACKHIRALLHVKMTQETTDGRRLCPALETSAPR